MLEATLDDVRPSTGRSTATRRGRRRQRGLDQLRDRRGARPRPHPPKGRAMLDAADHHGRAEGPRGAKGPHRAQGRRARRRRAADLAGAARGRGGRARLRAPALRRHHRRRPGRDRARRAAAAARRADHHHREERAAGRLLAQALQVALPARSGLVRPPALPAVPRRLAGFLAQGQDRRLAGDLHQGHGAELLASHRCKRATLRRGHDRSGRSRSCATANRSPCGRKQLVFATGMSGYPNVPHVPGAETFKGEQYHSSQHPGARRYTGKKAVVIGSNNSAHDICADLWEHGADVTMVQRSSTHIVQVRLADGPRRSAASTPSEALAHGITTDEGRPDLRLAALPDAARRPDAGLRGDRASATPSSTRGSRRPASSSTSATTAPACS